MTKSLASHYRDGNESISEILERTTYDRCTVLFKKLRSGHESITLRKTGENPPTYHLYRLNEHGAYCHDREVDKDTAFTLVKIIRESEFYVGRERDAAENVWPGQPHGKHPSWSGGER